MKRTLPVLLIAAVAVLVVTWTIPGAEPVKAAFDLSEYKTVETAITTRIGKAAPNATNRPAFLGLHVTPDKDGKLAVTEIAGDSPAARSGLQRGDVLRQCDGKDVAGPDALRELLLKKVPGDSIKLTVLRQGKALELIALLTSPSRPIRVGEQRALLGLQVADIKAGEPKEGEGVVIQAIAAGSPADKAKLKVGEVLLKIDGIPVTNPDRLRDLLAEKKPNDLVTLTLFLAEKAVELKVGLGAEQTADDKPRGFGERGGGPGNYWRKDVYKLAIICVEYPDAKHNPKIASKDWEDAMFSRDKFTKTNATGQAVYGSMADYYWEQSYQTLKVEGKCFDYVEVSKKRLEYQTGNRTALFTEALDKLLERDGKEALKDFDGVFFLYAGGRVQTTRGSLYWPHRASFRHGGKSWPYFICPEGGERMANISVFCHEFGHMLGLPDLYARPENPGSEGLSIWCAMSNQAGNGRPQHFCAWPKEKLGWIKPAVIDPTVPQKLILAPIEDSPQECFKVLVRPDGSEYLLLENRSKKGFDKSLPADGLLIWRVVGNRPILEESHGVEGPAGPRVFQASVPYPSQANDSFTPYTTPSSRSQLGGGLPVYITNIKKLPDGRITFHIGYEYQ